MPLPVMNMPPTAWFSVESAPRLGAAVLMEFIAIAGKIESTKAAAVPMPAAMPMVCMLGAPNSSLTSGLEEMGCAGAAGADDGPGCPGFGMAVVGAVNAGPPAGWACGCAAG